MNELLSLTKVGNLKLGLVRSGQPIATERILVTLPTKESEENFKIMPGFKENGEEKVNVTLPFDDIDLNFEVFNVAFITVNEVEYIAKAKEYTDRVLLYPLNVEDFDKPVIDFGEFSAEMEEKYTFKKTGFLKVHMVGISGFGEVFYFKTNSINSIRTIRDQLTILSSLTGGKLAGLELVLKAVKKDVKEKQIIYLSISFAKNIYGEEMASYLAAREASKVQQAKMEELYIASRTPEKIIPIEELKDAKIEIDTNKDVEISEIKEQSEKESENKESALTELFKEKGISKIPASMGVALHKAFVEAGKEEEFEDYLTDELTLPVVMKKIKELTKKK